MHARPARAGGHRAAARDRAERRQRVVHRQVSFLGDAESSLGDAESSLSDANSSLGDAKSSQGDAESSLSDAKGSLGDAESSLGDAESSLGDAKSSRGDAESSLGDAESSLGDAESSLGDAKSSRGDAESSLGDATSSHLLGPHHADRRHARTRVVVTNRSLEVVRPLERVDEHGELLLYPQCRCEPREGLQFRHAARTRGCCARGLVIACSVRPRHPRMYASAAHAARR
jgi:Tfp pilus assembly protein PilX